MDATLRRTRTQGQWSAGGLETPMVFRGAFRRTVAELFGRGFQNKTAKTFRNFQVSPMNKVSQDIGYRRPKKISEGLSNEPVSATNQFQ